MPKRRSADTPLRNSKPGKRVASRADEGNASDDVSTPNAYLAAFNALVKSWPQDMTDIFSPGMNQARRQELWQQAVDEASAVCERYAWAIPDARALRIVGHFAPIIEIGAGRGYWALLMREAGIDCIAFDKYPPRTADGELLAPWTDVKDGGPEQLALKRNAKRSLFLCYPDDYEDSSESLALSCLEKFQGDTIIHAGELFGDTPMVNAGPWGRTTGPEFQLQLFTRFRCVLKVPLPRWPVSGDYLTVWQRCKTCTVTVAETSESAPGSEDESDVSGGPGAPSTSGRTSLPGKQAQIDSKGPLATGEAADVGEAPPKGQRSKHARLGERGDSERAPGAAACADGSADDACGRQGAEIAPGDGSSSDSGSDRSEDDANTRGEEWDGESSPYPEAGPGLGSLLPCGKHTRFEEEDSPPQSGSDSGDEGGSDDSDDESEYEFVCTEREHLAGPTLQTEDGFAVASLQHLLRP